VLVLSDNALGKSNADKHPCGMQPLMNVLRHLYCWRRDAVLLQHHFDLQCTRVNFSVFDNLLLVHNLESGRVQIIDVAAGDSTAICPPQPFAIAQLGVCRPFCYQMALQSSLHSAFKHF
jgi:hypothetical protein